MNASISAHWPVLAGTLAVLVTLTALLAGVGRLGLARATVTASLRAVGQLAAVSLVIVAVLRSGVLTTAFITLMFVIASGTAARRITGHASGVWVAGAIAAGVVPVLGLLMTSGLVPLRTVAVLPVAGILIGGAMTAGGLAGRRALDELDARHGEYEARLALGFPARASRHDVCRPAAAQALLPALDQTRTVGLVTLPGAFVGVLLAGASPIQAGITQLVVLIGLLGTETIAVLVVVETISAGLIQPVSLVRR
ncbi:MAG TPA: ABC transporter permease [Micromonosporaceae bacterium]|nr:ABC transporter permease [Micromonosporaceae bacterium]